MVVGPLGHQASKFQVIVVRASVVVMGMVVDLGLNEMDFEPCFVDCAGS